MRRLSILCVTQAQNYAWPFLKHLQEVAGELDAELVLGADRVDTISASLHFLADKVVPLIGKGYVESVLDEAIAECSGDYILRMDDDEKVSPAMLRWLAAEEYRQAPHWKFCTANLWEDAQSVILNPPLWPDHHTRLSVKSMAGGRHTPHAGSPFGGGELAPVIHEHHKFLVKSREEREAVAARYDAFQPGYGTGDGLRPFSLPETCFTELQLAPLGDGTLREWSVDEIRVRSLA